MEIRHYGCLQSYANTVRSNPYTHTIYQGLTTNILLPVTMTEDTRGFNNNDFLHNPSSIANEPSYCLPETLEGQRATKVLEGLSY